jgi:hypothetical protein
MPIVRSSQQNSVSLPGRRPEVGLAGGRTVAVASRFLRLRDRLDDLLVRAELIFELVGQVVTFLALGLRKLASDYLGVQIVVRTLGHCRRLERESERRVSRTGEYGPGGDRPSK